MQRFAARAVLLPRAAAIFPQSVWVPRRWASEEAEAESAEKTEVTGDKLAAKVAELEEALKAKDAELKKVHIHSQYVAADAENARRIAREDTVKAKDYSVTAFAKDMLEVSDTLSRAVQAFNKIPQEVLDTDKQLAHVLTGVKMSESVLLHNLSCHGVEDMKTRIGDEFDPNKHDALFNAPATEEITPGSVANIVKSGFMIKGRVLRAAQVGVAQE